MLWETRAETAPGEHCRRKSSNLVTSHTDLEEEGEGFMRVKIIPSRLLAVLFALLVLVLAAPGAVAGPPIQTPGVPDLSGAEWGTVAPEKGMVSVSQPLAAKAGAEMLARGGNAIDAAAAIQFALNVEEPMMTGIGGGCFIMIYSAKDKKTYVIDGRERAPAAATPRWFLDASGNPLPFNDAVASGRSVGVPGTLMATATALERFGTLGLADVMQPAIKMADDGITVTPFLADSLAGSVGKLKKTPGRAYTFLKADDTPLVAGDLLVQKDLANTFRNIGKYGIDYYYKGPIATAVANIVAARGAPMVPSDIQTYSAKWRTPVTGNYRGWEVVSMPPPSSGGLTAVQVLEMLEKYPIGEWGFNTEKTLHTVIDTIRVAWADRAKYMGDIDFVSMPLTGLVDPTYAASRASLVDPNGPAIATPSYGTPPGPWVGGPGSTSAMAMSESIETGQTTHFVAADRWGNVVTWTTTIESGWGSGIMVPGFGFLLNNELTDFDFVPEVGGVQVANRVEAFKRPRSSMTPTLLFKDGKPWMATGSPGGATIINTVLQMIMNVVDHGMTIEQAVLAPRISHTSTGKGTTSWETGVSPDVITALKARGHIFSSNPTTIGSAQSLVIDLQTGRMFGAGDPRRNGTVISVKAGRSEAN